MGCFCSRVEIVKDSTFTVEIGCKDAQAFLVEKSNWNSIIPGEDGTVVCDDSLIPGAGTDWALQTSSMRYAFTNIVVGKENEDTGECQLMYDLRANGKPLVDFSFNVAYIFTPLPTGGCSVRRNVTQLQIKACPCLLAFIIPNKLRESLELENANMQRLMVKGGELA
jgi:hypothetical protein